MVALWEGLGNRLWRIRAASPRISCARLTSGGEWFWPQEGCSCPSVLRAVPVPADPTLPYWGSPGPESHPESEDPSPRALGLENTLHLNPEFEYRKEERLPKQGRNHFGKEFELYASKETHEPKELVHSEETESNQKT